MNRISLIFTAFAAAAGLLGHQSVWAQQSASQAAASQTAYPTGPIRLVVSSAAGGTGDTLARIISKQVAADFGVNIIIDNRPGASGIIAADTVAKADPKGYTLLQTSSSLITAAAMGRKLPYDVMKDLAPIINIGTAEGYLVLVNPAVPAKSIPELVAVAKNRRLLYGSPGTGNGIHFMTESMNLKAGMQMTHVPYKGLAPAIVALLSGELQVLLAPPLATRVHITSGKMRALASVSKQRVTGLPDLPTMQELGFKGFTLLGGWQGVFAPGKTPAPVISKLHNAMAKAIKSDEVRTYLQQGGYIPDGSSPAEFRALLQSDFNSFRELSRVANIKED
jgi:tripartite-type tricarboxylate transporter receptor subunit TctC